MTQGDISGDPRLPPSASQSSRETSSRCLAPGCVPGSGGSEAPFHGGAGPISGFTLGL